MAARRHHQNSTQFSRSQVQQDLSILSANPEVASVSSQIADVLVEAKLTVQDLFPVKEEPVSPPIPPAPPVIEQVDKRPLVHLYAAAAAAGGGGAEQPQEPPPKRQSSAGSTPYRPSILRQCLQTSSSEDEEGAAYSSSDEEAATGQ